MVRKRIPFFGQPVAAPLSRVRLWRRGFARGVHGPRWALAMFPLVALVAVLQSGRPASGVPAADRKPLTAGEYTDCRPTSSPLVLDGGYEVSLCYETAEGAVGEGRGGVWASGQAGLLWFFDRGNAEVLVKVLNGCSHNGRRWVYVAPVTDVAFNLHVTSRNGRRWTHRNRLGATAVARSDTSAFVCATDDEAVAASAASGAQIVARSALAVGEYTDCQPTTSPLVFDGGYQVSLCYETAEGVVGEGRGGIWSSGQSGLLWFFDRDNAEALVKVLDGCSYNGRRWVFVAPVTDLAFNLHVTSQNGRRWTHRNRLGMTASARSDTSAFDCATDDGMAALRVAPEELTFTAAGQTAQLSATALDDAGRVVSGAEVSWWSDNRAVATVDAAGLVTAAGIGTTTVRARWGSLSGEATIRVKAAPRVAVTPASDVIARGDTLRLVAEAYDEYGNVVEGATFTWSSSRGSVATVDGSGLVRGVALGEVTITATVRSGGVEGRLEGVSGTSDLRVVTAAAHDRAVLVAFYEAAGGSGWTRSDRWLTGAPLGDWYGVETDQSGRVVGIDLGGEILDDWQTVHLRAGPGLTGSISPELGRLTGLTSLNLSQNRLRGAIPRDLGRLAGLTSLNLSHNFLEGSIPPDLGRLAGLTSLNLSHNFFESSIPPELGRLANLRVLDLSSQQGLVAIPPDLGDLADLRILNLSHNRLVGIPSELGRLARLTSLNLSGNRLRGAIPRHFSRLASLRRLDLSYNELTELGPDVFVGMANLNFLDLRHNPGAPFRLTLRPERVDNKDFLAQGPARIRFGVAEGAPFRMVLPLVAAGGDLSAAEVTIGAGSARSPDVTVNRNAEGAGGTQVAPMAVPPLPDDFVGLQVEAEPIVLFQVEAPTVSFSANSVATPEGGTALLRLTLSEPAASAVSFTYSLGVDADPSTADAGTSDHGHFSGGSVSIAAGETSGDIEIPIVDDDELESWREVLIVALDPPGEDTGYVRGYPYAVAVHVEEGVCDRTPMIRDGIVAEVGAADCAAVDANDLAHVRALQFDGRGSASTRWNERSTRWSPDLVARAWTRECAVTSSMSDESEPGRRLTCVGDGELAGLSRAFHGLRTVGGAGTVTTLQEGDFGGLSGLRVLWLWGIGLTELPPNVFAGLTKVYELILADNELTSLPAGIFRDLDIRTNLDLSGNRLSSLPETVFSDVPEVDLLNLEGNQLTGLPPRLFAGLSRLDWLLLGNNPLRDLPPRLFADLPALEVLSLQRTQLTRLPPRIFAGRSGLRWLFLGGSRLTDVPSNVFSDLSNLFFLGLGWNQLTAVPTRALEELSRLYTLALDGNPLGTLEASAFSGLSRLEYLDLAEAELTGLSSRSFSGLRRLETLFLNDNQLVELPPGVFTGLRRLSELQLGGNPGSPFPLTLGLRRTDSADLRAPGPAKVALALEQGAPFNIRVPLSVSGGSVSAATVEIAAGSDRSRSVTVTGDTGDRFATQVAVGPAPVVSRFMEGVELRLADPLVLFGAALNQAPVPERTLPLLRLRVGSGPHSVDVSPYFRDPDGDSLTYAAAATRPGIVSVEMAGSNVKVVPVALGSAAVTVTATDPGGLEARSSLRVSVRGAGPGFFDIELILVNEVDPPVQAAFDAAVEYWSAVLAATELADVPLSGDENLGCLGITTRTGQKSVDDLLIVASARSIDGVGGTAAYAAVCGIRREGGLPFVGAMALDLDDAEWITRGDLEEVILHEIAHVLGFGTLWERSGLLRNPTAFVLGRQLDTHFAGPLAVPAFDRVGGTVYKGEKVPVEAQLGFGSADTHWRDLVFDHELMTPTQNIGVADPLSAVTIQSLADLGYTVDVGLAEAYTLPGIAAEDAAKSVGTIRYGDDTPRAPIIVVDHHTGRIVRTIPE